VILLYASRAASGGELRKKGGEKKNDFWTGYAPEREPATFLFTASGCCGRRSGLVPTGKTGRSEGRKGEEGEGKKKEK